jgi:hypothetical protein
MTPILTFTAEELGREVATLGAVPVGQVMRFIGPRAQASYAVHLPDVPRSFHPAGSMAQARTAIEKVVNEWLLRIGVFYPGQGVEVRVEHEDDDAEAAEPARARA